MGAHCASCWLFLTLLCTTRIRYSILKSCVTSVVRLRSNRKILAWLDCSAFSVTGLYMSKTIARNVEQSGRCRYRINHSGRHTGVIKVHYCWNRYLSTIAETTISFSEFNIETDFAWQFWLLLSLCCGKYLSLLVCLSSC